MDPNAVGQMPAPNYRAPLQTCSVCHQPVQPEWYFCPNCGNKLHQAPLKTDAFTQAWIYLFSIILPWLCFLFVTRWPGMKYYRSEDPDAKTIGTVAWSLLVLSTVLTLWLAYVWTEEAIQSTTAQINSDMSF